MRHPREFAPPWEAPIEFRSRGRWWLLVAGSLLICVASWVLTHDTTPGAGLSRRRWRRPARHGCGRSAARGRSPRHRRLPVRRRAVAPGPGQGQRRPAAVPADHPATAEVIATPASLPPHALDLEVPPLMWSSLPSNLRTVLGTALVLGIGVAVAAFTLSFFALKEAAENPELKSAAGTLYFNATRVPKEVRPIALAVPVASILVTLGLAYLLKMLGAVSGADVAHIAPPTAEPNRIVRNADVLHGEIERP